MPAYTNDIGGFISWQNGAARAVAGDLRGVHYSKAVPPRELARARETWAAVTLGGETRRRTGYFRAATDDLVHLELVQGKSTSEIGDELHLAPDTVRNHVRSLLKALGARTRLEAAFIALRHGLVSLDLDEG